MNRSRRCELENVTAKIRNHRRQGISALLCVI
jgi:hypothetical protein